MSAAAPPMFARSWAWGLFAALVLGLPAFAVYWRTPPALDRFAPLPGFDLIDQDGAPLSSLELRGRVVLLNLFFTRCPDVCPLLSARMAWLRRNLPERPLGGVPITLLSLTVDPEHDQPAALAAWAPRFEVRAPGWRLLTGPPDTVRTVIAELQQVAEVIDRSGETPRIAHAERILLIDAEGVVRGYYRSEEEDQLRQLRSDALRLARAGGT